MISQDQKIDCRVFVGEKYFRFFRNRLFQQNQLSGLTLEITGRDSEYAQSPLYRVCRKN